MSLEDLERTGRRHIDGLRAAVRQLWLKACEHDGVPSDSQFVVFNDDNPYMPFYNSALAQLREAQAAFVPGGGYVGLRIKDGRATTE